MAPRAVGFKVGETVAGYRIEEMLGRGGMGLVYRAVHTILKKEAAIKVIAPELVREPGFRQRFELEMVIAASLDHPHIASVYEAGEVNGQLYAVMRYVEGTDMSHLIRERGRMEPSLAAELTDQIASALDAAHQEGLVHRDVKPANVLLSVKSGSYHAYLTDFGLARREATPTGFTSAGVVEGTVDYMALEQARAEEVGPAADVYALGCVLFEALTGGVPFPRGNSVMRMLAKFNESPPAPSSIVAQVPKSFDAVVERAMAASPEERFPSAGELGRATLAASRGLVSEERRKTSIVVGSQFADCEIEEIAGRGGMGVVYRARQVRLGRTVALKVMSDELATDPAFRTGFEREMEIAASIDHPNVIPIHWAGEADGLLYIVMRFVQGRDLRELLMSEGPLDAGRAVDVIEAVAAALDAAHDRGLLHCDVKPSNVLVDDATGHVYLTDFGLASAAAEIRVAPAATPTMLGTTGYIAPELRDRDDPPDPRVDVFSLGCLLWDLLGGIDRLELARVDGVPPPLADVVERAVANDPRARFVSAGALARAARAALELAHQEQPDGAADPNATRRRRVSVVRQPLVGETISSGLADQVGDLCRAILEWLDSDELRGAVEAELTRLYEPLALAVIGAPNAGAPTLVNALVEPLASLRNIVLAAVPAAAEVPATVDALILVVGADDDDADGQLAWLRARLGELEASAANAIVVLTRADLADAVEPWRVAEQRARLLEDELGALVATVVPVSGLLAETANTGRFTERDAARLRELALMDGERRRDLLSSRDRFLDAAAPVSVDDRVRLLEMLGDFGIQRAVELDDAGHGGAVAVVRWLREVSGVESVVSEIAGFRQRADALKADRTLSRLEQLAFADTRLAFLLDRVEALRLTPEMHVLDLIRAFQRAVAGRAELPRDLLDEFDRLVTGSTLAERFGLHEDAPVDDKLKTARGRVRAWKTFENGPLATPDGRRVARVVARSYELIASQLRAGGTSPPEMGG